MRRAIVLIALAVSLAAVAACSSGARPEGQLGVDAIATQTVANVTGPPQTVIYCGDCEQVDVAQVIDGDTIDTNIGRIRFYGVDAPERDERCYGEATDFLGRLVRGGVRIETGPRIEDPFGRMLRYVYDLNGNSIEVQLIAGGFARAPANDGQHASRLGELEQSARANHAGCLWPVDPQG